MIKEDLVVYQKNWFKQSKVLLDKKKIMIRNFGSLVLRKKKERMGRNPKTKEEYKISKRYAITFYPAKNLKQSINEDI